nr:MAG TPA: hypothetical protein [Caudoviricetes sp.]
MDDTYAATVHRLQYWCQLVLPAVFDDSLSYYELVAKVVKKLNEIIDSNNELAGYVGMNKQDIAQLKEDVELLNSEFEKIKNGKYASLYIEAMKNWIADNLINIVGQIVKFVWFGLSDDGHFVAYIPTSWRFLTFDMVADPDSPDYGRLLLSY